MADDARRARSNLTEAVADPLSVNFFELLRQLEKQGLRFGRNGGPDREPARLGQGIRMSFAVSDIASVSEPDANGTRRVAVNIIGLLGPEGPMPLHLTRWVLERASNRWFVGDNQSATSDTSFLDFCNVLQHRMMAFYWRSWADTRPEVQIAHGAGGQVASLVRTLAGIGLPGMLSGPNSRTSAKLCHATSLAMSVPGPDRLTKYLSTTIGAPVRLVEFVGVWTDIPARLRSRLGMASSTLGQTAVVGARIFERQARAELRIGPLRISDFLSFLDSPSRRTELRHAILFASGHNIEFDIRLVLSAEDVPAPQLGVVRLGQTAWLTAKKPRNADNYRVTRFSGRCDRVMEMAA